MGNKFIKVLKIIVTLGVILSALTAVLAIFARTKKKLRRVDEDEDIDDKCVQD